MDRYTIDSMFGQGTFGRLYKARLRSGLPDSELPQWVGTESMKRAERVRRAHEIEVSLWEEATGSNSMEPSEPLVTECVRGEERHAVCSSIRSSGGNSNSSESDPLVVAALRRETLVIKEVPFQGLPPQEQQDILNEVRVMSAVNHSSFISYYESFLDNGCLYIVMELAEGGDLGQLLNAIKPNPLSESEMWRYLLQLLEGLSYLHSQRILHRDIKPANIFLDKARNIKIGDLGLGRILGSKSVVARTTLGTPLYFSPELCMDQPYDEKSDIWSLGCLLYEMATFQPPFLASNQLALAKKIVHDVPAHLPSTYSSELRFLIMKMLEKDPSKRPSIDQMLHYSPVRLRRQEALWRKQVNRLHTRLKHAHAYVNGVREEEARTQRRAREMELEHHEATKAMAHTHQQYQHVCELLTAAESAHSNLVQRLYSSEEASQNNAHAATQLLEQYALQLHSAEEEKEKLMERLQQHEATIRAQAAIIAQLSKKMEEGSKGGQMQMQIQHAQPAQQPQQQQQSAPMQMHKAQADKAHHTVVLPPTQTSTAASSAAHSAAQSAASSPPSSPSAPSRYVPRSPIPSTLPPPAFSAAAATAALPLPAASPMAHPHASPLASPALNRLNKLSRTPYLGPALRVPVNGNSRNGSPSKPLPPSSRTHTPKKSGMQTQHSATAAVPYQHSTAQTAAANKTVTIDNPRRVLDWSDAERGQPEREEKQATAGQLSLLPLPLPLTLAPPPSAPLPSTSTFSPAPFDKELLPTRDRLFASPHLRTPQLERPPAARRDTPSSAQSNASTVLAEGNISHLSSVSSLSEAPELEWSRVEGEEEEEEEEEAASLDTSCLPLPLPLHSHSLNATPRTSDSSSSHVYAQAHVSQADEWAELMALPASQGTAFSSVPPTSPSSPPSSSLLTPSPPPTAPAASATYGKSAWPLNSQQLNWLLSEAEAYELHA